MSGRPPVSLTPAESKLVSSLSSAQRATALWSKFEERKRQAKADRLSLGKELIQVRDSLAKKGRAGLFTRWLKVSHIPHARAYAYIALAGGGKSKTSAPCYIRKLSFHRFQTRLTQAKGNGSKVAILSELVVYVVKEFKLKAVVSVKEK